MGDAIIDIYIVDAGWCSAEQAYELVLGVPENVMYPNIVNVNISARRNCGDLCGMWRTWTKLGQCSQRDDVIARFASDIADFNVVASKAQVNAIAVFDMLWYAVDEDGGMRIKRDIFQASV